MNELNNSSQFLKECKMHVFSKKCIRNGITLCEKGSMAYRWLFYE